MICLSSEIVVYIPCEEVSDYNGTAVVVHHGKMFLCGNLYYMLTKKQLYAVLAEHKLCFIQQLIR